MNFLRCLSLTLLLIGCGGKKITTTPVSNFNIDKYKGKWYEIVRSYNSFEKKCYGGATAEYTPQKNGSVAVLNKCYTIEGVQESALGTAYFVGEKNTGDLKVTFFWPFYAAYKVIDLDPKYQYALVVGDYDNYFWILSRTPWLDYSIEKRLMKKVSDLGFNTKDIVFADPTRN